MDADVYIEFTQPSVVMENIRILAEEGKSMVIGTSGWYDHTQEVQEILKQNGVGAVYAHNYSIGMNIYLKVLERAANIFNQFPEYDVGAVEYHHKQKLDSPSGTAVGMAEVLLKEIDRKDKVVYDRVDRRIEDDELHFASVRCGSIPGTHQVHFDSGFDTITLTHEARNREGWAKGALFAAQWIQGKSGLFHFSELF